MTFARRQLLQAIVWTVYIAASWLFMRVLGPVSSGVWSLLFLLAGALWGGTETLRQLALRRRWLELPIRALLWRATLMPLVLAAAIQVGVAVIFSALLASGLVALRADAPPPTLASAAVYTFNIAILLWLWLAVWGGWQLLWRWRQREVEIWRTEAERRALELDVLRAQINPHFLFNALNNLRAMISEDPIKARDMVTRLSNILRQTLAHSAREQVPLGEELGLVRDFLALEQVQHEDRLRVRWRVADGLERLTVPPMALQLLVENAIKHGIARRPEGGELTIDVDCDPAGKLRLSVGNPGRWGGDGNSVGTGLGLTHLRERLKRAGGPGAACHVAETEGRVNVTLLMATSTT